MNPSVPGPEPARRRLGDILIASGALTEAGLNAALERQQQLGLPLARILVDSGAVPAHTIALALADQAGGALKTEYGFAISSPAADVVPIRRAAQAVTEIAAQVTGADSALSAALADAEALRQRVAALEAASAGVDELNTRLAAVHSDLSVATAARDHAEAIAAELLARVESLEQNLSVAQAADTAQEDDVTELRRELQFALAAREASESNSARLREQLAAAEQDAVAAREELRAATENQAAPPVEARTYVDTRHQLFVPSNDGYELIERAGCAPEPGSIVELSGNRSFTVLRVGPSPYPGSGEACGFLEQ